jgi:uncharacterized protein (DUF2147 family)
MKTAILLAALSLVPVSASASAHADDIHGLWQRGDGVARVNVVPCGTSLCMINTWIHNSTAGEKVGDKLIVKVSSSSDNWVKGTAFDPQRDRSYAIEMKVAGDHMSTTGCIVGGMLCKTVEWTRMH